VVVGLGPDLVIVKKATRVATGRKEVPDMALGKEEKIKRKGKRGVVAWGRKRKEKKGGGQVTGRERERERGKERKEREREKC
jgi:hypothetical protein